MKNILGIVTSPLVSVFLCTVGAFTTLALTAGGFWILFGLLGIPVGLGINYLVRKVAGTK